MAATGSGSCCRPFFALSPKRGSRARAIVKHCVRKPSPRGFPARLRTNLPSEPFHAFDDTALKKLSVLVLAIAPFVSGAAEISVRFSGLSEELAENVRAHLSQHREDDAQTVRRRLDAAVLEGLKPFGYYRPHFRVEPVRDDKGRTTAFNIHVDPGKRIRLIEPRLDLRGSLTENPAFAAAVKAIPKAGSPLLHEDYDHFKSTVQALALELGYFDGKFSRSALKVSPREGVAWWDLAYESGARYKFGRVTFSGSQIDEEYLQALVPFEPGRDYDYNAYGELSRKLTETNWFGSVVPSPDFVKARNDPERVLDVDVIVTPRRKNLVETGIGYATDIGPHGKISWTRPWLNRYGHSLSASADLSKEKEEITLGYKVPSRDDPLNDYWMLQSGYKYSDLNDTTSSSTAVSAARVELLESGWTRKLSVDWLYDNFTQGSVSSNTQIVYPTLSFSRTRQRGGAMPLWGDTQNYALSISDTSWGSDVDFLLLTAQQSWIRSLTASDVFVARWSAGWIETNSFEQVPPDLRFFAGGDLSVRGYDYKSISPKNDKGELEGGSKLLTVSLEYQCKITGNWWGALFVDAGRASHEFNFGDVKKGAGFGIRWLSPIGLVKLDLARPFGDPEEKKWKIYFGLGGAL